MSGRNTPRRKAVALGYDATEDAAPKVLARGSGFVAERIVELARENGIPIHDDPDLVALLAQVEPGVEIPEHLYRAVAEVLAFIYRVNQGLKASAD